MPVSRRTPPAGLGLANLARVAAEQGVDLTETYLLDGDAAREARLRIGRQRVVWASDGRDMYLSLPTPAVALRLDLGRRDHDEPFVQMFGDVPMYLAHPVNELHRLQVDATRRWVDDPANVVLIEELDLRRGEWACFGANWTVARLRSREGEEDARRVGVVVRLVEATSDATAPWLREPRLRAAVLPERFRDLVPLIRVWAIGDDTIRADRMTRARTKTLLTLWTTVGPRLDDIDAYLASPTPDESYEVQKLGRLAEATAEARIELDRRGVAVK